MAGAPEGGPEEAQQGGPPKLARKPVIVRIFRALVRQKNKRRRRRQPEQTPHQINEAMMARWTRRVGWFTGALVLVSIVTAVIFKWQLDAMQGQLDEAKRQRLLTIELQRANLKRGDPQIVAIDQTGKQAAIEKAIVGWMITPTWTNIGGTIARNFRGWFKIQTFNDSQSKKAIGRDCPNFQNEESWPQDEPMMESIIVQPGGTKALLGKPLSVRDAVEAVPGKIHSDVGT